MTVLEIRPYDHAWPDEFQRERTRLSSIFGPLALRIEHHGSTSVPGLAAKPVIDIQISVQNLHPLDRYAHLLEQAGYVHVPHEDDSFAPFFHRPAFWPHTHHVHVVAAGGEEERKTLAFRDYLRDHPPRAREYEALKTRLAARHSAAEFSTRQAYADAKSEFIADVTNQALAEGYPRGRDGSG
jgi:GrpB-like predicted nucleotidyltransferase (UPF0157 family)